MGTIWKQILISMLTKLAEAALPIVVEEGKKIIEQAWQAAEDWATRILDSLGIKVPGEQKMAIAVCTAQVSGLALDDAAIRSMVELEHLDRTTDPVNNVAGKTAHA